MQGASTTCGPRRQTGSLESRTQRLLVRWCGEKQEVERIIASEGVKTRCMDRELRCQNPGAKDVAVSQELLPEPESPLGSQTLQHNLSINTMRINVFNLISYRNIELLSLIAFLVFRRLSYFSKRNAYLVDQYGFTCQRQLRRHLDFEKSYIFQDKTPWSSHRPLAQTGGEQLRSKEKFSR